MVCSFTTGKQNNTTVLYKSNKYNLTTKNNVKFVRF